MARVEHTQETYERKLVLESTLLYLFGSMNNEKLEKIIEFAEDLLD